MIQAPSNFTVFTFPFRNCDDYATCAAKLHGGTVSHSAQAESLTMQNASAGLLLLPTRGSILSYKFNLSVQSRVNQWNSKFN